MTPFGQQADRLMLDEERRISTFVLSDGERCTVAPLVSVFCGQRDYSACVCVCLQSVEAA